MNRRYSLRRKSEIEELMSLKKSVGNRFYAIYYQFTDCEFRVAVSVSKKVGNAVTRNHEKRVVKEILRKTLIDKDNLRILIVVKKNSISLEYLDKVKEIEYLLNKIKKQGER